MASSSASALRMIGAPIDEPQHRRPKKIAAPNELSAPKWSNPSATPPLSNKPPSDRDVGLASRCSFRSARSNAALG
jgi:hypothetical protein